MPPEDEWPPLTGDIETLIADRPDVAHDRTPMLAAGEQLTASRIRTFDKDVRVLVKSSPTSATVGRAGIGVPVWLSFVGMVEDPVRFARSR